MLVQAFTDRARDLHRVGLNHDARWVFAELVLLKPNDATVRYEFARFLDTTGNAAAEIHYRAARANDPNNRMMAKALADYLSRHGKGDEAAEIMANLPSGVTAREPNGWDGSAVWLAWHCDPDPSPHKTLAMINQTCAGCRPHAIETMKQYPIDHSSRERFVLTGCDFHDAINQSLGKPVFGREAAIVKYLRG